MSDEDEKVGYGRPPKHAQFKPGASGNKKGRRRKERHLSIPRQARRDVLMISELPTEVRVPGGTEALTFSQLIYLRVAKDAAAGKPTAMKIWIGLYNDALIDRLLEEPQIALLDTVHHLCNDPTRERDPGLESLLDTLRKRAEKIY